MQRCFQAIFMVAVAFFAFVGCASDEEKMQAHMEKGTAYYQKGEYKSAELEFRNAAKIDPKNVTAHIKLGETYLKLGNSQGAFGAYSRVEQLDLNNINAQLKMATFFLFFMQNM